MDFSDEMTGEILKIFQTESDEIISRINDNLLSLETKQNDQESILLLFRDAHSLKGASRMVGFNNIQSIAHKIEDILGLAKDNKILISADIVSTLYKTVDFMSELIRKSIKKGQDIYSDKISEYLAQLDNIENSAVSMNTKPEVKDDFNIELFMKSVEKFNALIIQALSLLMAIEAEHSPEKIKNLLTVIDTLFELFKDIGIYEIKKLLEDVKIKLEFTLNGSNDLTLEETGDLQVKLDAVINKLAYLFELYNIEVVDYYSLLFGQLSEDFNISPKADFGQQEILRTPVIESVEVESSVPEIAENEGLLQQGLKDVIQTDFVLNFSGIEGKIDELLQHKISIAEVNKLLEQYQQNCEYENVKSILAKIIDIFKFVSTNESALNEDAVSIIKQTLEYCNNVVQNQNENTDNRLILQQLEIVQQILEIEKEKTNVKVFINPKEEQAKNITDFSDTFVSDSIKTLRVDSVKLDLLINQMNELTIEKIKTKKRLFELNQIIKDLEDNQKNISKFMHYLRYYGKKQVQYSSDDNSALSFMKQFMNLVTEDSKKIQKISNDTKSLYKLLQEDDAKMDSIVNSLGNMVKNIRILPFATVFHLFGRMVRDIAQEKGKKIDLEILGSETCTDKKIIEEIKTPLIHIIRNSIDHGIETPDERLNMGKSPTGKIILSAKQFDNKVIIEIKDDGRGINISKIKEKALSKGFLTADEIKNMSDEQITNLVFAPGFSTGDEITNISGRGIGLDVVQSKIMQLNGKVQLISELNKGCSVQIELPSTMLLMKVFIVKLNKQNFAIPMEYINTVLRRKSDEIIMNNNKKSIIFNDSTIPLFSLNDVLGFECANDPCTYTIMIVDIDKKKFALHLDEIIGEQEILQKRLSPPLYKLKNISGITTLISGETCLILNLFEIAKNVQSDLFGVKCPITDKNSCKKFKILVVDDSYTTRVLEKNILTNLGYDIETAENPLEALEMLGKKSFDLIISDVEMPEMTGLEFLEKIKTDEMFSEIPFIIVSSLANEDYAKQAKALGAVKYIVKGDFSQDDFEQTINEILK